MWYEILKKDLMKRKGINIILLLFITLSTIFLASSVSNIILVMNGVENYMECANVSDEMVVLGSEDEKEEFEQWLKSREEVTEYAYEQLCEIKADNVTVVKEGKEESIKAEGVNLYLGYTGGKYAKPLDSDGEEMTLSEGEVALSPGFLENNGLKVGDGFRVKVGSEIFTYKIAKQTKDIMYGNEMSGMNRFVFCREDWRKMVNDESVMLGVFGYNSTDREATVDAMNRHGFQSLMTSFNREVYFMLYVFDMIVAELLIVIGICLILISLMILKFSLTFTMEENYREIGVMKAIGMRDFSIRKIYFIKYLALVTVGALAGFFISIPVGNIMVESVSKNMVLGDSVNTLVMNLLCSLAVVAFVAAMCILFTGKLKKISAIEAIRNGETGERYRRRRGLKLHRKKYMGTVTFLGLNDILCNKSRYLVMFITFCISFVLISVPLNTLTTMESREMAIKFNLDPEAAIYMENLEAKGEEPYHNTKDIEKALERLKGEFSEKGYEAEFSVGALFFMEYTVKDDKVIKILSHYPVGDNGGYHEYQEGTAPKLENEVAFSKKVMKENGLQIGDMVTVKIGGEEKSFIITGYYSDYMQLGESARLNPVIDMSDEIMPSYWKGSVNMETDLSQEEMAEKLKKEFPHYDWVTAQEVVDANVGSIKNTLRTIQMPMTLLLCILIMLITLLMMKLFVAREKGQFAMLKSIGFCNRYIRMWLVMRMVWVVALSMIFAVPLSMLSNRFILRNIFAIMGAELTIQVDPLKAYLVYPGILFVGIVAAAVFATRSVTRMNPSDMKIAE